MIPLRILSLLPVLLLSRLNAEGPADRAALARIPETMGEFVDRGELAGAVTLVGQDGRVVEFDAVGYANLATRRPLQRDDVFWVASMTKPITAVAVLMLAEEGKLSLDDPIEKFLPQFKDLRMVAEKADDRVVFGRPSRSVTIRDLLAHTHGLDEVPTPAAETPLAEWVTQVARGPLQFEPGSQWKYGNCGMNVLGRIVEVASGVAFPRFLQSRLFDPLGMKDTTFFPDKDQLRRLAKSYKSPSEGGTLEEAGIGLLKGDLASGKRTVSPGAGLFSTAPDLFRFYQMMLDGGVSEGHRYLSEASVREMLRSQTGDLEAGFSAGMGWGLGFGIVRAPVGWTDVLPAGAFGHDGAYGTAAVADPGQRLVLILMIQLSGLNPYKDGLRFRHAFQSAAMAAFPQAK